MSTNLVRSVFDRNAEEFDAWFRRNGRVYLSELNALKAAGPTGRILDLGVGSGVFASRIGVHLGVDVSRNMLEISRKRGLRVLQADVKNLPIRDDSFDSVIVSFTICFADDALAMLNEAFRVLREKGRLVLGEITLDSEWGRAYSIEGKKGHRFYGKARFFTLRETLSLLSKSGFRAERAFGALRFGPAEEPRIEKAVRIDFRKRSEASRYGFVCLRAAKNRSYQARLA
jgi:ubiquinone/menaquinone biosynthesis C-methylase UbiE